MFTYEELVHASADVMVGCSKLLQQQPVMRSMMMLAACLLHMFILLPALHATPPHFHLLTLVCLLM